MALALNLSIPIKPTLFSLHPSSSSFSQSHNFVALNPRLRCKGKFVCLFFSNPNQDRQARKAVEDALSGKKSELEKWDKEIKKKEEEAGGGGGSGGRGWFGWGGGSGDDHFWQEAQQTSLAILGIVVIYLLVAKGDVMFATVINPLLFVLRGARNTVTLVASEIMKRVSPSTYANLENARKEQVHAQVSAKDSVLKKWGSN